MYPVPGIHSYTPSDETFSPNSNRFEKLKILARQRKYGHLFRLLLEGEMKGKKIGNMSVEELEELSQTYRMLLSYYANGAEDAERTRILREIGKKLLKEIRSEEVETLIYRDPHHIRTSIRNSLDTRGLRLVSWKEMIDSFSLLQERDSVYYDALQDIFNRIWTDTALPKEAKDPLLKVLSQQGDPYAGRAVVGALFLGGMEFFDPLKVELLLYASSLVHLPIVQGAALPALLFIGRRYQEELLSFHPELVSKAQHMIGESDILKSLVYETLVQTHISYNTAEDHRIFVEEILPTLKNVQNKLGEVPGKDIAERLRNLSQEIDAHSEQSQELKRMMEKAATRLDSQDITTHDLEYHNASLTKNHPFFLAPINWFLAFDKKHPVLSEQNVDTFLKLLPVIFQGRHLVSSDLFSYAMVVDWSDVSKQIERLGQTVPIGASHPDLGSNEPFVQVRDFIFGAYRFYRLFISKDRFDSPFTAMPYLLDGPFTQIERLFSEEEYLRLAGILGTQKHYISAGYTYARLVQEWGNESAETWRGLAVANMRLGKKVDALRCIERAIKDEGVSSITAINKAKILRDLGRRSEAVQFLEEAESLVEGKDAYDLTLARAMMLHDLARTDEALSVAFKAEYLEEEYPEEWKAKQLLVRILLQKGRANEAVLKAHNSSSLLLLEGIALIATGEKSEGISLVKDWVSRSKKNNVEEELRQTLPLLGRYGIDHWEQSLIYDAVSLQNTVL